MRTLILVILFLSSTFVFAQDKILLLNGKEVSINSLNLEKDSSTITFIDLKNKKNKSMKRSRIFSIQYGKGGENIFYKEDSASINHELSIEEMRMYIKGLQEAEKFKSPMSTIGGFVVGAGGSFLGFYGLIPPAVFVTIVVNPAPNMEKQQVSDKELLKNENFLIGYQRKSKSKKFTNAAIGGLSGFVIGFITLSIIYR